MRALIAGGGIGGLTAALALRQRGIDALLFEQAEAFREVGAGIQVSANAVRVLRALGLGDDLARIAVAPLGLDVRSWQSGERILWTELGRVAEQRFGAPYYHVHRAELLDILVRALGGRGVHTGARVVSFTGDDASVTVTVADGRAFTGDVLVGADGIHSTIRARLFGEDRPRVSGNVAWRGLAPTVRVTSIGLEQVTGAWWGPNRSMVHYFVSSGRLLNWVGIGRAREAGRESWSAEGSVAEVLAEFAGWHPHVLAMIAATTRVLKQALYDRDPLPAWQQGRVVLLGDAAHAMMPFHAQGAAQSIEDAYLLAGSLAATPDAPIPAIDRYVRARKPRAEWVQRFSRDAEELCHMAAPAAIARRDARLREHQARYANSFPPAQERLYGYDADAALQALDA